MPRHNAQLRLPKAQITILRARIPRQRIILSPADKAELMRIGAECGDDIDGLHEVARSATCKRWLVQMRVGTFYKSISGPPVTTRSAAPASWAASSHPTPAMRRECPLSAQSDQNTVGSE